jgi:hypothetical protein
VDGFALQDRSLQDIMNDMVRTPARLIPAREIHPVAEAEALMTLDPILAGLHKEKLNAQTHYHILKKKNGARDPMTRVAADMVDSLGSAFETRLIELRQDRVIMISMRRVLRAAAAVTEAKRQRTIAQYHMRLYQFYEDMRKKKKVRREQEEHMKWMILMMWILQTAAENVHRSLSLGRHFTSASLMEERA